MPVTPNSRMDSLRSFKKLLKESMQDPEMRDWLVELLRPWLFEVLSRGDTVPKIRKDLEVFTYYRSYKPR